MTKIFTDLAPNAQISDLFSHQNLDKITAKLFPTQKILFFHAARDALQFFFANLPKNQKIGCTALTCIVVPNAIHAAHQKFIPIDLENPKKLLKYWQKADPRAFTPATTAFQNVDFALVQNTFGIPAQIPENIPILENSAHGIPLCHPELDSGSHPTILSFGRDKSRSCIHGGALILPKPDQKLEKNYQKLEIRQKDSFEAKIHIFTSVLAKNLGTFGKIIFRLIQKLHFLPPVLTPTEKSGNATTPHKIHPKLKKILANQLSKTNKINAERQKTCKNYQKLFSGGFNGNLIRWPLLVTDRALATKKLQEIGVIPGEWYLRGIPDPIGGFEKSCPNAAWAANHLILLPTTDIDPKTTQKIAETLKKYVLTEHNFSS